MSEDRDRRESADLQSTAQAQATDSPAGPGTSPSDPYPDPDTAQTVFKQTIASSFALVIIHLLLALLFDCLRWVNLLLALYHLGFGIYVYRKLKAPRNRKTAARSIFGLLMILCVTTFAMAPVSVAQETAVRLAADVGPQRDAGESSQSAWFGVLLNAMFGEALPGLARVKGETKPAVGMEPPDPPPTLAVSEEQDSTCPVGPGGCTPTDPDPHPDT